MYKLRSHSPGGGFWNPAGIWGPKWERVQKVCSRETKECSSRTGSGITLPSSGVQLVAPDRYQGLVARSMRQDVHQEQNRFDRPDCQWEDSFKQTDGI